MADGSEHARLRAIAARVERAFPLTCRRTLLILSDLDPDQLQAQWQVEPGHLALVRGGFPSGLDGVRPRLRLLRVDAGDREVAALSLPDGGGQEGGVVRFLVSGGLGTHYRAELGLASPEGGWLLLTRSEVVSVPTRPLTVPARGVDPRVPVDQVQTHCHEDARHTPENEGLCRDVRSNPAEAREAGVASLTASDLRDPTLADSGVPLAPVFPLPSLPEGVADHLAPGATVAILPWFRRLPAPGIIPAFCPPVIPLIIAREPPPPAQPGEARPGIEGPGEGDMGAAWGRPGCADRAFSGGEGTGYPGHAGHEADETPPGREAEFRLGRDPSLQGGGLGELPDGVASLPALKGHGGAWQSSATSPGGSTSPVWTPWALGAARPMMAPSAWTHRVQGALSARSPESSAPDQP